MPERQKIDFGEVTARDVAVSETLDAKTGTVDHLTVASFLASPFIDFRIYTSAELTAVTASAVDGQVVLWKGATGNTQLLVRQGNDWINIRTNAAQTI